MPSMLRFLFVVLPALTVLVAALGGCNPDEERPKRNKNRVSDEEEKPRAELKAASWGTVKGKVVLDDGYTPPKATAIVMGTHDASCHSDSPREDLKTPITPKDWEDNPEWIVGQGNGVKNVAVFLQPPEGKFFYLPKEQRKLSDVVVEQPHCAFIPRVFTTFPSYYDPKPNDEVSTDQAVLIKSSPRVNHNYSVEGADLKINNLLPAGSKEAVLKPRAGPQPRIMRIKCDIHTWMRAYGIVLDHPYAAVTNDNGEFTIHNAPLGVELQIVAWHEGGIHKGFFLKGGEDGDKMTLSNNQVLPALKVRGER